MSFGSMPSRRRERGDVPQTSAPREVFEFLFRCLKGLSEWHNGEAYHLEMLQAEWNADDGHAIEKAYHEIHE